MVDMDTEKIKGLITCDRTGKALMPYIEDVAYALCVEEDEAYTALDEAEEALLKEGYLTEEDGTLYVAEARESYLDCLDAADHVLDERRSYHDNIWGGSDVRILR